MISRLEDRVSRRNLTTQIERSRFKYRNRNHYRDNRKQYQDLQKQLLKSNVIWRSSTTRS